MGDVEQQDIAAVEVADLELIRRFVVVALTPAGAVLLEQGRITGEAAGAAIERARRAGTQPRRLTVAVKPGTGTDLLRQIMQRCAADPRMPQVRRRGRGRSRRPGGRPGLIRPRRCR